MTRPRPATAASLIVLTPLLTAQACAAQPGGDASAATDTDFVSTSWAGGGDSDGSSGGATTTGVGGSSSTGDDRPPEICKQPPALPSTWFVEVTDEIGLGKTDDFEPLATGIVAGDLDGDGWEDLIAAVFPAQRQAQGAPPTRFVLMNRPAPQGDGRVFVDATAESGLTRTRDGVEGRGFSVTSLGDLDNDGDLDAITCPGSGEDSVVDPCAAFLNDGSGHFDFAPESALESEVFWVPSSVMLDWDEDGLLDFWPGTVGQWAYGPALTSRPRLYRGLGDGTFEDASAEAGLPDTAIGGPGDWRMNFGVTACDLDLDGDREVLTGNYYEQPNYAFFNEDGVYANHAAGLGLAHDDVEPSGVGGHTFSIACGDIDDDGDVDLMTAELRHAWVQVESDHSELLRNDPPPGAPIDRLVRPGAEVTGLQREHTGDAWTEGDNIAIFADIDLDGRKDVVLASSNYPQQSASDPDWTHTWLYHQRDDGSFEDATSTTPWAGKDRQSLEGPVLVDFDHDGDLDLVIGTGIFNSQYLGLTNTMRAFRNDVGQDSNWTRIRLVGGGEGKANRSALGAVVTVTAGGRTMRQEVLGSWGHSNTQSDVLVFGLGEACEIDSIEVRWPDAADTVERFDGVRANYALEIEQGDPQLRYLEP
ncbi:MAG: CRTAC1 family protein [Nannocystaceae bacterium]|nr:CRTAC1 family protein [Nannocystaceae bacterium]